MALARIGTTRRRNATPVLLTTPVATALPRPIAAGAPAPPSAGAARCPDRVQAAAPTGISTPVIAMIPAPPKTTVPIARRKRPVAGAPTPPSASPVPGTARPRAAASTGIGAASIAPCPAPPTPHVRNARPRRTVAGAREATPANTASRPPGRPKGPAAIGTGILHNAYRDERVDTPRHRTRNAD